MSYINPVLTDGSIDRLLIPDRTEAEDLLIDWYNSWLTDSNMPPKPKTAIHIRTIVYFMERPFSPVVLDGKS